MIKLKKVRSEQELREKIGEIREKNPSLCLWEEKLFICQEFDVKINHYCLNFDMPSLECNEKDVDYYGCFYKNNFCSKFKWREMD